MPHKWLAFSTFGLLTVIIIGILYVQSRPLDLDAYLQKDEQSSLTLTQPTVTVVNPSLGSVDAPVTLVMFADFTCYPCKQLADSILAVMKTYPQDVRFVWKDMPQLDTSSIATQAAVAAHCADRQGKFWEYADELFARQAALSTANDLLNIAENLFLDTDRFSSCMETQDTLPIVERDYEEGTALGLLAAPTLFVNGTSYTGALSTDQLLSYVEEALANN